MTNTKIHFCDAIENEDNRQNNYQKMRKKLLLFFMTICLSTTAGAADYKQGDVNHDGKIDITDVVMLVDYILEKSPEGFYEAQADKNKDGKVDISDVIKMVNVILTGVDDDDSGNEGPGSGSVDPPIIGG